MKYEQALWTALCCLLSFISKGQSDVEEKRLIKHLLEGYNTIGRDGRPVANASLPMAVNITFGLIQIKDVDLTNEVLELVGWVDLEWKDDLLKWTSEHFGITKLSLRPEDVWTPDIELLHAVSKPEPLYETRLRVGIDGRVTWSNAYHYHVVCAMKNQDLNNIECMIKFASWSMHADMLDLKPKTRLVDAKELISNRIWELYITDATRSDASLPWNPGQDTAVVSYKLPLIRRVPIDDDADKDTDGCDHVTKYSSVLLSISLLWISLMTS